jgi:hypothetical protein
MWNLLHDKSVRLDWKLQHKLLLDTAKGMVRTRTTAHATVPRSR